MRRVHLVAALLAASCGGSPTTPSTSPPANATLTSGAYTLTLSHTTIESCQNGFCKSVTLCIGPAGAPSSGSFPVTVTRDGDRVSITPVAGGDSFRMTLALNGASVTGSLAGSATSASGAVITASGTVAGVISSIQGGLLQGLFEGDLSIAGASCSGTTKNWVLAPRP